VQLATNMRARVPQHRTQKMKGPNYSVSPTVPSPQLLHDQSTPSHSSINNTQQSVCLQSPSPYPMLCSKGLHFAIYYPWHVTDSFRKTT